MKDFEFHNPVKIFFGRDQLKKISSQISKEDKVLLLYGSGSIFKNGVYHQIKEALKDFEIIEFGVRVLNSSGSRNA